ncbi:MAG: HutD family protein [Brevibacterium sp.]
MRVLTSFHELSPVPWANGAGETTELVSLADSVVLTPGLRRWRLSIAALEMPGRFSSLPGMARSFLPTAEVVLEIDGRVHRVEPRQILRFHGEQEVTLLELSRPCHAVNLMVADADADADADAVASGGAAAAAMRLSTDSDIDSDAAVGRHRFAVTLDEVPGFSRFQLLELEAAEVLPAGLDVVILH